MNGKQLKNSILQLAIQGKLVAQDANDEPADVLLKRIRQSRAQLVKEGKLKKDKNETTIYRGEDNAYYERNLNTGMVKCIDDEIPFDIPDSWEWARLRDISIYIHRGKSPKYSLIKKYPVVAQKCNQWSGFSIKKAKFIEPSSLASYGEERLLQDDDLLWNSTGLGTLGRMAVYYARLNPYDLAVADSHVTVIRLQSQSFPKFFYYYFASPTVQCVIEDKADGSTKQKELATETICNYLIPLPPLAEQRRIVKRIEELLPYVERYGRAQEELDRLNGKIKETLKKSILQEAIQGKLVPQDADDEPAAALLKRIRQSRAKLVKAGKLKKDKNETTIYRGEDNLYYEKNLNTGMVKCIDDEIPFEIPDTWEWVRIRDISNSYIGLTYKPSDVSPTGIIVLRSSNIKNGQLSLEDIVRVNVDLPEKLMVQLNDILICARNGSRKLVGKSAIIDTISEPMTFGAFMAICKTSLYGYVYQYLQSDVFFSQLREVCGTTTVNQLTQNNFNSFLIPIPPLAEQHRIVAKIEELFRVLDTSIL